MSPNHGTQPGPRPVEVAAPVQLQAGSGPAIARAADSARRAPLSPLSPDEFARLYSDSWRILWCAAASVVRDRTLAQDIVQQAAIVALERLDDFDPGTSFVSWMVRIVKNLGLNEARKNIRRRTTPTDGTSLDAAPASSGAGAGAREGDGVVVTGRGQVMPDQAAFDDDVLHALDDLDDTARGCLLLRVVLDMAYRDIALAMDIPEGTAASHVHRARKVMRERLRPQYAGRVLQGEQP
jgi:RNA polymerase sigma-70 factor (ECF subfamily)